MTAPWCAFLGPSLPWAAARALAPGATLLPPARQGDIWRALRSEPVAIALIDGVFEAQPSVWHHELVDALEAGVAVFGASSMGALRASELAPLGMVGVGEVFRAFAQGALVDDSEVALLHADAEADFRPFTLPLVNVRRLAEQAHAARVLSRRDAETLVRVAERLHYQDRDRGALLEALERSWSGPTWRRFAAWAAGHPWPDVKATDAAECLQVAAAFAQGASRASPNLRPPRAKPSSLVRRQRLTAAAPPLGGASPSARSAGATRFLLAAFARSWGLSADSSELQAQAARLGGTNALRQALSLLPGEAQDWLEDDVLAAQVLEHASQLWPDGASSDELVATGQRLRLHAALGSPSKPSED